MRWNLKEAGSKVPTRGTRIVSGIRSGISLHNKTKSNKLHGHEDVNTAGTWDDSAEHEGYAGALTDRRITENNNFDVDSGGNKILERILSRENLNRAYKQVKRNKGAHGVDGMEVEYLLQYLKDNGEELVKLVLDGKYHPNPVRRVEIPKDNGKMRKLGIPTAVDRVLQQAIAQVPTPIFEPQFAETSYGFRPKRSAHDALKKCVEYANEGYTYVVDMDLEKFFDTVNQSKMIEILSRTIKDGRVISLIHKYLRAGAVDRGRFEETETGLVQGGNICGFRQLVLDDVPDRYFMARLSEAVNCERLLRTAGSFELRFVCPDPYTYAIEDEVFVLTGTGTHAAERLAGNADSEPVYFLKGMISTSSSSYISLITNGEELRIVGSLSEGETLVIDSGMVTAKVTDAAGNTLRNGLPCLQELNFPVLRKGVNNIGIGAVNAAFTELKIQAKSRWR